jgi:hypothetical protein
MSQPFKYFGSGAGSFGRPSPDLIGADVGILGGQQ